MKINYKGLIVVVVLSLVLLLIVNIAFKKLIINVSESHPGTLFFISKSQPQINEYVHFNLKHDLLPQHIEKLSKKLICTAGADLIIGDKSITCKDKTYPIKRTYKTKSGTAIPQFYYQGQTPNDMAVVWGENSDSFDSRYWGFIQYNKLTTIKLIF